MPEITLSSAYLYEAVGGKLVCLVFDEDPNMTYPRLSPFRVFVGWPPDLREVTVVDSYFGGDEQHLGITLPNSGHGSFWPFDDQKACTWDDTPLRQLSYSLYEVVKTQDGVTIR